MGIAHGGAPSLRAKQHLQPGAGAQGRRPRPPLPPGPLPPLCQHPQTRPGAAGDSELGADGRGGEEFRLRLLWHQSGILPWPYLWLLHGLANVGLTLEITWPHRALANSRHAWRRSGESWCSIALIAHQAPDISARTASD